MQRIIVRWWWVISGVLLSIVYGWGVSNMYFHQDDLDWFILANRPLGQVMSAVIGDHVNYIWRILLSLEWNAFGLNFPPYLLVSCIIHFGVVGLLYKLLKLSSGRRDLAGMGALIFTINTNWTETVLWISGQTISLTALFVLWSMIAIWRKKGEGGALLLTSWTSALAIGVMGASVLVYKKLRWKVAGVLLILGSIYVLWAGDGTHIVFSLAWMVKVGLVWGLMFINSVIGRLLIPFDRFEAMRIGVVGLLTVYGLWKMKRRLLDVWRDSWSRFLLLHLAIYNLVVAVGRAQYGVGIMRAERYSYIGLMLGLLWLARVLRRVDVGRWYWLVPVIVGWQSLGLYHRAETYIVRPQQLKNLVEEMRLSKSTELDPDAYLPHFVLNDERLKYRDLMSLTNH